MALTPREGSLLDAREGLIVHGCNAQGVMGSGVAAAIREAYPQAYADYRRAFEEKGLKVGQIVWTTVSHAPKLAIANAITQEYYGRDKGRVYVDYDALRRVFGRIGEVARQHAIPVHFPMIGAGLANGDWAVIAPIIETALAGVDHTFWIPPGTPLPTARRPRPR